MPENDYEPTQIATTIEQARLREGMSVRKSANLAALSEGRWRQIAKGYQKAAKDTKIPVNAPADTLAKMANAVGLGSKNFSRPELFPSEEQKLVTEVHDLLKRNEEFRPFESPIFGGSYEDPSYIGNIEEWVMELQRRIEHLEERVTLLTDPDYSNMSAEDARNKFDLAAKEADQNIGHDELPHEP